MLATQMAAPNSPQWFNTGLHWAYGIDGPSQGHFYVDFQTGKLTKSKIGLRASAAARLLHPVRSPTIWSTKAASWTCGCARRGCSNTAPAPASNFSSAARRRRAAVRRRQVVGPDELPQDRRPRGGRHQVGRHHAARRQDGDRRHRSSGHRAVHRLEGDARSRRSPPWSPARRSTRSTCSAILKACVNCEGSGDDCFDPEKNPVLRREIKAARTNHVPDNYIQRVIQFAKQGYTDIDFPIYDTDWDSEAYLTVSGQNSNNSVRVTDEFLKAVEADGDWDLTWRTKPGKIAKTAEGARPVGEDRPRRLGLRRSRPAVPHHGQRLAHLPGVGPDPRLQSVLGIHVPRRHRVQSRLDEPAGVPRRQDPRVRRRRLRARRAAVDRRARNLGADGAVPVARRSRKLSYEYRTLGLGYANIGGLLMSSGIPYDSDAGRAIGGALTAIMTGISYATSAEMADRARALPGLQEEPRAHAARDPQPPPRRPRRAHGYEKVAMPPVPLDHKPPCPDQQPGRARQAAPGTARSNSASSTATAMRRSTVIAPTGTIGLVMDCDTTGIEPDFALVKFKKLAGGGYFKIINRAVPEALRALGYGEAQIAEIEAYAVGHGSLGQAPGINHSTLKAKGFTDEAIAQDREGAADRLRHQVRLQQVDAGRGVLSRHARHRGRETRRPDLRPARRARLHQARDRGRQHPRLRRDDGRRRAAPQGRALSGVRLRQSVRPHRQALSLGREPHPHDGGGAAVHLGRHLQDHQHAERRHGRGLQAGLPAVLEAGAEGQRALPRRLETVAAAAERSSSPTRTRRTTPSRPSSRSRRPRASRRWRKRWSRRWSSASW